MGRLSSDFYPRDRKVFDRLLRLSDGVFAITLTLLVLSLLPDASGDLTTVLASLVSDLADFWVTVFVVAIYWREHLVVFDSLRGVDGVLVVLNFLYLGLVALIPLPNRLLSLSDDPLTYVVFAFLLLLLVVVEVLVLGYARLRDLLTERGSSAFRSDIIRGTVAVLFFSASMPLAFVLGGWTPVLWLLPVLVNVVVSR
ncbi:MAG: TMEM175 family protein [Halobacteriales archaeon]|nr:TMEM175 family protein [Halobacteriales archaeon]